MAVEIIKTGWTFSEPEHSYMLGDQYVPSVTQVIGGVGLYDLSMVKQSDLERAAANGVMVHEYCCWFDDDDLDVADLEDIPKELGNRVKGWIEFRKDWEFTPKIKEQAQIIAYNGMYLGLKPDRIGVGKFGKDGAPELACIEIKCTADVAPHMGVQLAAYCLPFKANGEVIKRYVCQLLAEPSNGKSYKLVEYADRNDERVFLAALGITHWKLNNKIIKRP